MDISRSLEGRLVVKREITVKEVNLVEADWGLRVVKGSDGFVHALNEIVRICVNSGQDREEVRDALEGTCALSWSRDFGEPSAESVSLILDAVFGATA